MLDFLDRIYEKETTAAMRLKTVAGQRRRLEAFLNKLQEYNADFLPVEDAYNEYLKEVQQLIGEYTQCLYHCWASAQSDLIFSQRSYWAFARFKARVSCLLRLSFSTTSGARLRLFRTSRQPF